MEDFLKDSLREFNKKKVSNILYNVKAFIGDIASFYRQAWETLTQS